MITTSSPNLQGIAFDAYGTLFNTHSVINLANQIFPEHGTQLSEIWRTKQLQYTWLLSLMGHYEDFWNVTKYALTFACQQLNLICTPAIEQQLMDAYNRLELYPEVKAGLKQLSDRYPLVILSNGSPDMLKTVANHAEINSYFRNILSADSVSIYKPAPQVYQLAVRAFGVSPSSIGFVSSNAWDIAGAKAFGFWTCWINRTRQPQEALGLNADLVIEQLTDLLVLLST
ncbi:MAG: haloacid dehalogenase type II [Elainellaceae cyanobacterium]